METSSAHLFEMNCRQLVGSIWKIGQISSHSFFSIICFKHLANPQKNRQKVGSGIHSPINMLTNHGGKEKLTGSVVHTSEGGAKRIFAHLN